MDARTRAWSDQENAHATAMIRRYGLYVPYIGGDECSRPGCECPPSDGPPFAYTVGLFGLAHPELLVFGLPPETAALVLDVLASRIEDGDNLLPGQMIELDEWHHRIVPEPVPNPGEIVFEANRYYQRPDEYSVPVLQLSYDDPHGRFPWEEGYDARLPQPRPGTFKA